MTQMSEQQASIYPNITQQINEQYDSCPHIRISEVMAPFHINSYRFTTKDIVVDELTGETSAVEFIEILIEYTSTGTQVVLSTSAKAVVDFFHRHPESSIVKTIRNRRIYHVEQRQGTNNKYWVLV